ncbi:MAG: hypothetical protein AAGD10_14350 [Myxococcota bacterium]
MLARTLGLAALLIYAGSWGCAIPSGSYARPVQAVEKGTNLIGGGLMVPFASAGAATSSFEGDASDASFAAFGEGVFFGPGFSYDRAFADGSTWGIGASVFSTELGTEAFTGVSATLVFLNPRFEFALGKDKPNRNLSFVVDGNLGFWTGESGGSNIFVPIVNPSVGLRYYAKTGYGGVILSQNVGTAFVTLAFPGSVAYDLPIGDKLHIFPEFRWDPTFFAVSLGSTVTGVSAFFSGGLAFMVEL